MATDLGTHLLLLAELEARQNDALDQLEVLDQRVAALLRACAPESRQTALSPSVAAVEVPGLPDGAEQPQA